MRLSEKDQENEESNLRELEIDRVREKEKECDGVPTQNPAYLLAPSVSGFDDSS